MKLSMRVAEVCKLEMVVLDRDFREKNAAMCIVQQAPLINFASKMNVAWMRFFELRLFCIPICGRTSTAIGHVF